MTIHLRLHVTGRAACGVPAPGPRVTNAYYRDLCRDCIAWQTRRCRKLAP